MTRYASGSITALAAIASGIVTASPAATSEPQNLAALISLADASRDSKVQEVRSLRHYTLRNARWKSDVTMEMRMITSKDGLKRYEILNTNADGIRKQIIMKILDGEVQAAAKKDRDGNINDENYELRPTGGPAGEHKCRPVKLIPKKRTRFTFDGHGCVDLNDMAMVRMEGRTAKNVSFFVGRAYVIQEFRKVGDFWYSSLNQSTADVKFFGPTEMTIKYLEYSITTHDGTLVASSPHH